MINGASNLMEHKNGGNRPRAWFQSCKMLTKLILILFDLCNPKVNDVFFSRTMESISFYHLWVDIVILSIINFRMFWFKCGARWRKSTTRQPTLPCACMPNAKFIFYKNVNANIIRSSIHTHNDYKQQPLCRSILLYDV